jgi:hypothetical protein
MMKGILLHHWDTDGICSSVILRQELAKTHPDVKWTLFTPRIGNYFLTQKELEMFRKERPDEFVIVDMAIPTDQVKILSGYVERLTHFDHHYQPPHNIPNVKHYNPVSQGKEQSQYPAATFVLMEHFHRKMDLPTTLGVVGDLEHKVFDNAVAGPKVKAYGVEHGLGYGDLMRMVDLINSNFKTDDAQGVRTAADKLAEAGEDPAPILFNEDWQKKATFISEQVGEWLKEPFEDMGQFILLRMSSSCHIISTVGRHLFRRYDRQVVLVNTGLQGIDQIYVRGTDMRPAIEYARGKGLRAGGKTDAFGAVLEKGKLDEFLPGLLDVLKGKKSKK